MVSALRVARSQELLLLCPALRRIGDSDIEDNATRNTSVAVERSFLSADEKQ
jgi:hypothetical protein